MVHKIPKFFRCVTADNPVTCKDYRISGMVNYVGSLFENLLIRIGIGDLSDEHGTAFHLFPRHIGGHLKVASAGLFCLCNLKRLPHHLRYDISPVYLCIPFGYGFKMANYIYKLFRLFMSPSEISLTCYGYNRGIIKLGISKSGSEICCPRT